MRSERGREEKLCIYESILWEYAPYLQNMTSYIGVQLIAKG